MTDEQEQVRTPETEFSTTGQRERGGCLSAFLMAMIILNSLIVVYYLVAGASAVAALPNSPSWGVYVLAFFGALNVFFAYCLRQWKKVGFYGFMMNAVLVLGFNVYIGINPLKALFGLGGPVVLYLLLRPVWKHLE